MRKKLPTGLLVIAILHFVGGGLGLAGSLCGLALQGASGGKMFSGFGGQQAGQAGVEEKLEKTLEEKVPAYQTVHVGRIVVDLVLSTLMIASGIGLLQTMAWGRSLSIVYALLSILNHLFSLIYDLAFTVPATRAIFEELVGQDPTLQTFVSFMEAVVTGGVIVGALFVVYPIIVLIVMFRPSVVRAFGTLPESDSETEGAEEDADLPWGRLPPGGPSEERFRGDDR
jgi:hypothetical protein